MFRHADGTTNLPEWKSGFGIQGSDSGLDVRAIHCTFPTSACQWNSFVMRRSARSDSVSWSIESISTRLAACIVAACLLYTGVRRRWRSRHGAVRAEFSNVGSVSAMAPFWTISRIFGIVHLRRGVI